MIFDEILDPSARNLDSVDDEDGFTVSLFHSVVRFPNRQKGRFSKQLDLGAYPTGGRVQTQSPNLAITLELRLQQEQKGFLQPGIL